MRDLKMYVFDRLVQPQYRAPVVAKRASFVLQPNRMLELAQK